MSNESATSAMHEFLRSRRSVRRFTDQAVDDACLNRILETGLCAPNSHNRQPWRFAIVQTKAGRSRLADEMAEEFRVALEMEGVHPAEASQQLARSRSRIEGAPVVIVLCVDYTAMDTYNDSARNVGERVMAMQSVALAGGQMLLAAHAEGLGGVWVCAPLFAGAAVRRALELPDAWEPQGMLLIGHPAGEPKLRSRQPIEAVAVYR